jgi:hypothetical protein
MKTSLDLDVRNNVADYDKREHLSVSFTVLKVVSEEDYKALREAVETLETIAKKYIEE